MSEEENQDVNVEIVTPSNEEIVKEQQQSEEPKKGSAEYNFRELRSIVEEQKRALQFQQNKIQELEYNSSRSEETEAEDDLDNLSDDDYLTVKQAFALLKKQEIDTQEDKVRIKFKDYDDVVSEENVLKLIENDRELADTLRNSPNPYSAAYKLIKKSTFFKEKEESAKYKNEVQNIQKNAQKPVSSNAIQSKSLAKANAYASRNKGEMESIYREMVEFASRRN